MGAAMFFKMDCPHCKRSLNVTEKAFGKTVACPGCNQPINVPDLAAMMSAAHLLEHGAPRTGNADTNRPTEARAARSSGGVTPVVNGSPLSDNDALGFLRPESNDAPVLPPLPPVKPSGPPVERAEIFCPRCGQKNIENNFKCIACAFVLHGPSQPQNTIASDDFGGLIPYKNSLALCAYYLGVLSLIPCIGFPLGVAALVLGIMGLKYAGIHPESKGKIHAWVGVILGSLSAVVYGLLIGFGIIGAIMSK